MTDSIVVEGISRFDNNMEAKITYAAFDSDNHVTRASRTLTYSDYTVPTFQLEVPLAFHNGNFDLLACITANSCLDGDLSSKIKVTVLDETTSIYEDGDHLVEFRVTDSMGKTSYLRTHVLVDSTLRSSAEDSPLQLKQTMVTLQVGASFDPTAYLVLQDGLDLTAENVNIQSTVDTAQAGDYEVTYRYANGQENAAATRLVVVVKG